MRRAATCCLSVRRARSRPDARDASNASAWLPLSHTRSLPCASLTGAVVFNVGLLSLSEASLDGTVVKFAMISLGLAMGSTLLVIPIRFWASTDEGDLDGSKIRRATRRSGAAALFTKNRFFRSDGPVRSVAAPAQTPTTMATLQDEAADSSIPTSQI